MHCDVRRGVGAQVMRVADYAHFARNKFESLEDWNKINSREIQRPLSGGTSFSLNEPLQAVQEMEDDDDCIDDEEEEEDNDDDSFVE